MDCPQINVVYVTQFCFNGCIKMTRFHSFVTALIDILLEEGWQPLFQLQDPTSVLDSTSRFLVYNIIKNIEGKPGHMVTCAYFTFRGNILFVLQYT